MKPSLHLSHLAFASLITPGFAALTVFDGNGDTSTDYWDANNWNGATPSTPGTQPAYIQADATVNAAGGASYTTDAHHIIQNDATWTLENGVTYTSGRSFGIGKSTGNAVNQAGSGHVEINGDLVVSETASTTKFGVTVGHSSNTGVASSLNVNPGGSMTAWKFTVRNDGSNSTFHSGSTVGHYLPSVFDLDLSVLNGGMLTQNTTVEAEDVLVDGANSVLLGTGTTNMRSLTVTNGGSSTTTGLNQSTGLTADNGTIHHTGNTVATLGVFSVTNGSDVTLVGNVDLNASGTATVSNSTLSAQTVNLNGTDLSITSGGAATFEKLLIQDGTSATVGSGGSLSVTGEIDQKSGSTINIASDASLPGGDIDRMRLRNTSMLRFEIAADGAYQALDGDSTNGMIINFGGTAQLDVNFAGEPTIGEFYDLFTGVSAFNNFDDSLSGFTYDLANVTVNGLGSGQTFDLSYDTSVANEGFMRLSITAVPEPSSTLFVALGTTALLFRRRRG